MRLVLAALIALFLPISSAISETGGLEGRKGRNIRVWMSADDAVCGRIFHSLDRAISRRVRVEDTDDVFTEWRQAPEIGSTSILYDSPSIAEVDIDNDGVVELLVRFSYSDRYRPYGEGVDIFNRDDYAALISKRVHRFVYAKEHAKWRIDFGISGEPWDRIIPKRNLGRFNGFYFLNSRRLENGEPWKYPDGGEFSPFAMNGQVYVLVDQSDLWQKKEADWFAYYRKRFSKEVPEVWGGVVRFSPDGTAVPICHFQPNTTP